MLMYFFIARVLESCIGMAHADVSFDLSVELQGCADLEDTETVLQVRVGFWISRWVTHRCPAMCPF